MEKPTIRIHDQETNEIIEREMTDAELQLMAESFEEFETQQAERLAAKTAAEEKLAAFGITADDLKALGL